LTVFPSISEDLLCIDVVVERLAVKLDKNGYCCVGRAAAESADGTEKAYCGGPAPLERG
jgi:hypothetical protein